MRKSEHQTARYPDLWTLDRKFVEMSIRGEERRTTVRVKKKNTKRNKGLK